MGVRRQPNGVYALVILGFLAIVLIEGLVVHNSYRQWAWVLSLVLLGGLILVIGWLAKGTAAGVFIDERNRISLSRFQIVLWTTLILPAISTVAWSRVYPALAQRATIQQPGGDKKQEAQKAIAQAQAESSAAAQTAAQDQAAANAAATAAKQAGDSIANAPVTLKPAAEAAAWEKEKRSQQAADKAKASTAAASGAKDRLTGAQQAAAAATAAPASLDALDFKIPQELWALLGISLTSTVASLLILTNKKQQPVSADERLFAVNIMDMGGDRTPGTIGPLLAHLSIENASWADLIQGEETGNVGTVDITRVQNLFFTVVLVYLYGVSLWRMFDSAGVIPALPAVSSGMATLLGISHAGYLAAKAAPKSADGVGAATGARTFAGIVGTALMPPPLLQAIRPGHFPDNPRLLGTYTIYGTGIGEQPGQENVIVTWTPPGGTPSTNPASTVTLVRPGKITFELPSPPVGTPTDVGPRNISVFVRVHNGPGGDIDSNPLSLSAAQG